jgi:hypothetical protein
MKLLFLLNVGDSPSIIQKCEKKTAYKNNENHATCLHEHNQKDEEFYVHLKKEDWSLGIATKIDPNALKVCYYRTSN